VVKEITEEVRQLGPATKLVKELPVLDEYSISRVQIEAGRG